MEPDRSTNMSMTIDGSCTLESRLIDHHILLFQCASAPNHVN